MEQPGREQAGAGGCVVRVDRGGADPDVQLPGSRFGDGDRAALTSVATQPSCPRVASTRTSLLRLCSEASRATYLRPAPTSGRRSEEHTSELQSRQYLVCRL